LAWANKRQTTKAHNEYVVLEKLSAPLPTHSLATCAALAPSCTRHSISNAPPQLATRLSAAMLDVYRTLASQLTLDVCPHYVFTPRDMTHWVIGMARYDVAAPPPKPTSPAPAAGAPAPPVASSLIMAWANEGVRIFRGLPRGARTG